MMYDLEPFHHIMKWEKGSAINKNFTGSLLFSVNLPERREECLHASGKDSGRVIYFDSCENNQFRESGIEYGVVIWQWK
jgi:hypothetical protein